MSDLVTEFRLAHPAAADLAMFASPAVRVEPSLLRALRLELLPAAGPEVEADLWFSRLVRSRGPDGIALRPDVLETLRTDLRGDDRAADAWAIIEAAHAGGSPALVLEERVAWLVISEAGGERIEGELHRALAALEGGARPGLARWAANAWTRLPDAARETPAGWLLGQASGAGPLRVTAAPDGIGNLDVAALAATRVPLGIRLDGAVLELGAVAGAGAVAIDVLDTEPRLVDVVHERARETVAIPSGAVVRVPVGDEVRLVNALHDVYELSSLDIFARLRAAPPELARAIIDYEPWVRQHTREFVEREAVVAELDRILDELPCGYVLINGSPGSGKTTFLSHLVERRGYAHHFRPGPMGSGDFLTNSCAQVIVRYGLPYTSLPPGSSEGPEVITRLLGEASSAGRVVLLVDVIDLPTFAGELPRDLPHGVFVVAATRPGGAATLAISPLIDINLGHDVDAVREFAERRLAGTDVDRAAIASRSEGNFFVASLLIDEALAGVTSGDIPPGLDRYFEGLIDEMTAHDEGRGLMLLRALAASPKPVSMGDLGERAGLTPDALRGAIRDVNPVLVLHEDAIGLYLSSFATFVREHFSPRDDPLEALWIGPVPFLNRAALRAGVRAMMEPDGPAILVVNGPRGSGKSSTATYLRHVAEVTGRFQVALRNATRRTSPREIVTVLKGQISRDWVLHDEVEDVHRENSMLADSLVAEVDESGDEWWLVIDGFADEPASPDVVDLVTRLAAGAEDGRVRMRLVLLGWNAPLPAKRVYREDLDWLTRPDVREFLAQSVGARISEAEIDAAVATIFARIKPDDLNGLATRVTEVYQRLTSDGSA